MGCTSPSSIGGNLSRDNSKHCTKHVNFETASIRNEGNIQLHFTTSQKTVSKCWKHKLPTIVE